MNNFAITPMVQETLSAWYRFDDATFQVKIYLSSCKKQCCFYHEKLGEVRIDKESETLHSFTKPLTDHYKHFLLSVVQQWKHQFPHYQMDEQKIKQHL